MRVDIHCDRCDTFMTQRIAHIGVINQLHLPLSWKEIRIGAGSINLLCPSCVEVVNKLIANKDG